MIIAKRLKGKGECRLARPQPATPPRRAVASSAVTAR
jgi:hypothetical protein